MTEPVAAPAEPTVGDLRQQLLEQSLQMARWEVYAQHPQLRELGLLEDFQGGPDQIRAFGNRLAERFPAPAPTPAPLTAPSSTPAPATGQVNPPPVVVAPPMTPQAPESTMTPTPSPQDILPQQSADVARAEDIRQRMRDGIATRQDVLWLSQHGPRREVDLGNGMIGYAGGFVSAVKGLNR